MSGVRSFLFKMNFGCTVGQCWNRRWGMVCFVSFIVSELKWIVFFEFLFVRYSSTMLLWPLMIASISGDRPQVVDKAKSFRPCKIFDYTRSKCCILMNLTFVSPQNSLKSSMFPVQQAMCSKVPPASSRQSMCSSQRIVQESGWELSFRNSMNSVGNSGRYFSLGLETTQKYQYSAQCTALANKTKTRESWYHSLASKTKNHGLVNDDQNWELLIHCLRNRTW